MREVAPSPGRLTCMRSLSGHVGVTRFLSLNSGLITPKSIRSLLNEELFITSARSVLCDLDSVAHNPLTPWISPHEERLRRHLAEYDDAGSLELHLPHAAGRRDDHGAWWVGG